MDREELEDMSIDELQVLTEVKDTLKEEMVEMALELGDEDEEPSQLELETLEGLAEDEDE